MREIKFRGKRVDNDEWVYGDIVFHYENQRKFILCDQMAYIYTECGIGRIVSEHYFEVIPETIGQYTGLKDTHNKEIYEGDIITTDLQRQYLIVEYRNGAFMLNCNDGLEDYYDIFFGTSEEPKEVYKYGEVIGNIHDNPELVEQ